MARFVGLEIALLLGGCMTRDPLQMIEVDGTGGSLGGLGSGGNSGARGNGGSGGASSGSGAGGSSTQGRRQVGNCPLIPPRDPTLVSTGPGGGCSLAGRWALSNSHGSVQTTGVIEFEADGSYYGGPPGIDLSQTYAFDGAYSVSGTTFSLIYSCGDGSCVGSGSFTLQFQSGCAVAVLNEASTQCTGNRLSVAGRVVLTRE